MAKKTQTGETKTADYRHTREKRKNNPPAQIAAEGNVPKVAKVRYEYSPHLPPVLRSDPSGRADKVPELIATAGKRALNEPEQKLLSDALRNQQPWLEWAGKQEQHNRGFLEVDPVALHIHERVSTQAIVRVLEREDVQRGLFADPEQSYEKAVQFYKHEVDWANRLILGDSLQVMASLAKREELAGKIQMIYLDPPYGIRFGSNFQPQIGQREVKDRDQDLIREPETVRAYRDTWMLGVHSYLSYLRDRFRVARDLLADSGSIFVQISDENLHRVRSLMDEVFGVAHFCGIIIYQKTTYASSTLLPTLNDYLLWYGKDRSQVKYRQLFSSLDEAQVDQRFGYVSLGGLGGFKRMLKKEERARIDNLPEGSERFMSDNITSPGGSSSASEFTYAGKTYHPGGNLHWKTDLEGMTRLGTAGRLFAAENSLRYVRLPADFPVSPLKNVWTDTTAGSFQESKIYVVQTSTRVIERCLLMTTDAGDLVFDPTCGSGTTAYIAEQWGRRWITCDSSRVAISLARQRLMTARFSYYNLRSVDAEDRQRNPRGAWLTDPTGRVSGEATFKCKTVPHITLKSIARNSALDAIVAKHASTVSACLDALNLALSQVTVDVRRTLAKKLAVTQSKGAKKAVSEVDRRRWDLPNSRWREWEVPIESDPDWPEALRAAFAAYVAACQAKMNEVNACIASNAEMEELVDKPEEIKGIVRVAGPFTVEGVRPEELSLVDGSDEPSPNDVQGSGESLEGASNAQTYLTQMIQHLRADGLTFLDNKHRRFSRLDTLFESGSGSLIHAEGTWEEDSGEKGNTVAITFGPQHGPVTALQLEEAIRAAKQYDELVVAGFSFDAEAFAVAEEQSHPKLRVHLAQIRPDLNQAMHGLLKDTPNSQLFTVFGQPDVEVKETKDGWMCSLNGVEIYNPLDNTVRSSGADKVAAWFLDSDFDGRCFCITQAFFPDQNAWEKIAKALGGSADPEAFEAFKGTTSLPFKKGKYGRIAVKVIDPRGNEVMAIRKLGAA